MWKLIDRWRRSILVWLTHSLALPAIRRARGSSAFPYVMADLEHFPLGSVGSDLWHLLKRHGYALLSHYELHDVKHLLLGYHFTEEDEVKMQFYFVAQGVWTAPALGSVLIGTLLLPEYFSQYLAAYRRGKAMSCPFDWNDPALLTQPTAVLQYHLNTY